MSDYNKITDYSAKDALSSGDAAKRVKGSEIGADFDAVAVAVATKADTNGAESFASLTINGGGSNPLVVSGSTTNASYGKFSNTSGEVVYGVNNSVAGTLYTGGTAYAAFFGSNVAKNVDLLYNAITKASITTTGLEMVGDLVVVTKTPASAGASGVAGTIAWDSSFLYVCTATNTWKRVAIATW